MFIDIVSLRICTLFTHESACYYDDLIVMLAINSGYFS